MGMKRRRCTWKDRQDSIGDLLDIRLKTEMKGKDYVVLSSEYESLLGSEAKESSFCCIICLQLLVYVARLL